LQIYADRFSGHYGIWISGSSTDPSRDAPLRNIETQFEQFAVNARCSPGWILGNHAEEQRAKLFADTFPSAYLSDFGDPCPIQTKPHSMPVHNGSRGDQDERFLPAGPACSQRNPEQLVQGRQSTARSLRVQSQQLLTESHVFKDEVLSRSESADHPPKEMPKRRDHGKNLSGKVRSEPCAKSFILWVYDDLARHSIRRNQRSAASKSTGNDLQVVRELGIPYIRKRSRADLLRGSWRSEVGFVLRYGVAFYSGGQSLTRRTIRNAPTP
jgi:hypothetical protein